LQLILFIDISFVLDSALFSGDSIHLYSELLQKNCELLPSGWVFPGTWNVVLPENLYHALSNRQRWKEVNSWDSRFRMLSIARIQVAFEPGRASEWGGFINYPGIGNIAQNYRFDYGLAGLIAAWLHLMALHRFDLVLAMSEAMASQLHRLGLTRLKVIGNFVDEEALR